MALSGLFDFVTQIFEESIGGGKLLNIEVFQAELQLYIIVVLFITIIFGIIINLLFGILKVRKILYEAKVWILTNLVIIAIAVVHIFPVGLDIYQSSYCTISNVIEMEISYSKGFTSILVTDSNGTVYDCDAGMIDEEIVDNASYPGTVIYAKHSGLMLRYYPSEEGVISE